MSNTDFNIGKESTTRAVVVVGVYSRSGSQVSKAMMMMMHLCCAGFFFAKVCLTLATLAAGQRFVNRV